VGHPLGDDADTVGERLALNVSGPVDPASHLFRHCRYFTAPAWAVG
jgi:hypothetical protein